MKDNQMIEQLTERAVTAKTLFFGALGSSTSLAWLFASLKAATVLFQCIAALAAAVAGCLTVFYMIKKRKD
jgi:hypothetical protein